MKKKIVSLLLVAAMAVSLVACGDEEEVGDISAVEEAVEEVTEEVSEEIGEIEELSEDIVEDINEDIAEDLEEIDDQQGIINLFESIYKGYKEYLEEGYEAEGDTFVSPGTGAIYYNPMFTLCDANGDNYDDLVIWGDFGIRDKKVCEVYFYVEQGDAFLINTFDGFVDALSEGCVLVEYDDREVDSEIYYENYSVYQLTPTDPALILAHYNKDDNGTISDTYYAGEEEISEEEYNDQFAKYEAAIIPLGYEEMTEESIAEAFSMLQ